MTANERDRHDAGAEQTTVLPETAADLVQLEKLQQALAESEERAKSHWEQYLRAVAELDNVRKRAQRDIESANRYGLEKFAAELLPVQDSLALAVQSRRQGGCGEPRSRARRRPCSCCQGARQVRGRPRSTRSGEPFDPARHEAMLAQESATAEPNSVLQVVQPGYELNGRLLRPARVIVAKEPSRP